MTQDDPGALREHLRGLRRELSPDQQISATAGLLERIRDQAFFRESTRIAFYVAVDGEVSPRPLLLHALDSGKHCYLPVVAGEHELDFVSYEAGSRLEKNRWGIPEPAEGTHIEPQSLDLVLAPLTGFTLECHRLGSGKGYYDRAFTFRLTSPDSKPMLVGIAHECQLVESVPVRYWDVPLDAVATPERILYRVDSN